MQGNNLNWYLATLASASVLSVRSKLLVSTQSSVRYMLASPRGTAGYFSVELASVVNETEAITSNHIYGFLSTFW